MTTGGCEAYDAWYTIFDVDGRHRHPGMTLSGDSAI